MLLFIIKTFIAAALISFCSWLAAKKPDLAGFIIALPVTSMIALVFSYLQHQDNQVTTEFAKSILIGIPVSLLFFVPFLFSEKWQLNFYANFALGLGLLACGYFIHSHIIKYL